MWNERVVGKVEVGGIDTEFRPTNVYEYIGQISPVEDYFQLARHLLSA